MVFALRLAQRMGMTLSELKARMSSREFGLHMALSAMDNAPPELPTEPPTEEELEYYGNAT